MFLVRVGGGRRGGFCFYRVGVVYSRFLARLLFGYVIVYSLFLKRRSEYWMLVIASRVEG